jgi:Holliday junction DNA helicase RuvA
VIGSLTGRLAEKRPAEILVETGGVGYRVAIPLSTFERLPDVGATVSLTIHTHVREDALLLYGFHGRTERDLFQKLIGVPGVGPRLALAVLSHLPAGELVRAVRDRDGDAISRVPGIGRKTAERLLVDLHSKLGQDLPPGRAVAPAAAGLRADLLSALENLGYRGSQAGPAVDSVLSEERAEQEPIESLLRAALRRLASPATIRPASAGSSTPSPTGRGTARSRRAGRGGAA